jgi:FkbM family methyltransferase
MPANSNLSRVRALFLKQRAAVMAWMGPIVGKPRGWERVMRRLVPFADCPGLPQKWIRREGVSFLAKPSVPIGYNVTFFGTYEPELRALMRRYLRPGGVAIDVGANVGWHTLLMAQLVGPNGRILAVEANPSVRERLAEHLQANHLSNVTIVPSALGSQPGKLRFLAPPVDSFDAGDGHVAGENDKDERHIVETEVTTLDALTEREGLQRLDFVKIDVEGFEWPVLQGAVQAFSRFRPVVCFEFNTDYTGRGEGDPEALRDYFDKLDYEVAVITRRGPKLLGKDAWPDSANLLAMPSKTEPRSF